MSDQIFYVTFDLDTIVVDFISLDAFPILFHAY